MQMPMPCLYLYMFCSRDVSSVVITVKQSCPVLTPPSNGDVTVTSEGIAMYSCDEGFQITSPIARACQSGRWNGTTPRCFSNFKIHIAMLYIIIYICKITEAFNCYYNNTVILCVYV